MRTLLALTLLALLLTPLTTAGHCSSMSTFTTDAAKGRILVASGNTYLAIDACAPGCGLIEVYTESNGVGGLQRVLDSCHKAFIHDTKVL